MKLTQAWPYKQYKNCYVFALFAGSGEYVVIILSSLQARIVMMNKVLNSTNMIF